MYRPRIIAWVFALAMASTPALALEEQPTNSTTLAQQRFREATDAYKEGRYSAAASLFEAADRLAPHPSTRYNAAAAWEEAGEAARAATGYEAALALDTLDEGRRAVAEQRLASLKKTLARVKIQQPLGALVTVDHVQRAPVPTTFYLRPGSYNLAVEYRGDSSTSRARVFAGRDHEIELDLPIGVVAPPPVEPRARRAQDTPLARDRGKRFVSEDVGLGRCRSRCCTGRSGRRVRPTRPGRTG